MKVLTMDTFSNFRGEGSAGLTHGIMDIIYSNNKYVVGGDFTTVPSTSGGGKAINDGDISSNCLAVYDNNWNIDVSFQRISALEGTAHIVDSIKHDSYNNKYVIGGSFCNVPAGKAPTLPGTDICSTCLAIYDSNWNLDNRFERIFVATGEQGRVKNINNTSNKYIISGNFVNVPGSKSPTGSSIDDSTDVCSTCLAVYDSNWNIDQSFNRIGKVSVFDGVIEHVNSFEGKYIVSGDFKNVPIGKAPTLSGTDVSSTNLAVYDSSWNLDVSFGTIFNGKVIVSEGLDNGDIAVGGLFLVVPDHPAGRPGDDPAEVSSRCLAVYDRNWNVKKTFSTHFNNTVMTIKKITQGNSTFYVVGGYFTQVADKADQNGYSQAVASTGIAIYDSDWNLHKSFNNFTSSHPSYDVYIDQVKSINNHLFAFGNFDTIESGDCNSNGQTSSSDLVIYDLVNGEIEPSTVNVNGIKPVPIIERHMCYGPFNEGNAKAFAQQNPGLTQLTGKYGNSSTQQHFFFPKRPEYCLSLPKGQTPNNFLR